MHKFLKHSSLFESVAVGALLAVVFLVYSNSVDSLDLWAHLNTGRVIHQSGNLPSEDLFSYTTSLPASLFTMGKNEVAATELPSGFQHWSMNLDHSWLGQLVLYLMHDNFGLRGLGILKSTLFLLTFLVLYAAMRRGGAHHFAAFLTLALVAYLGTNFNYTRPQIFSFFFFAGLLYLLVDFQKGGRLLYGLPAIMLLWANIHGGFIMGVMALLIFSGGELLQSLVCRPAGTHQATYLTTPRRRLLLIITCLTLLAGLLNPNGYRIFTFPWATMRSLYGAGIMEYQRPDFHAFREYWFMLILAGFAFILRIKRAPLSELLLVAFLTATSLLGMRAIIYFGLGTAVFLARSLTAFGDGLGKTSPMRKTGKAIGPTIMSTGNLPVLITTICSLSLLVAVSASGNILKFKNRFWYPDLALHYIKTNQLPGRLFNFYDWGGYINWTLPDYKVFIDGRCLNETAFFHYNQIITGARGSENLAPLWARLLDAYNIRLILIPTVARDGYPYGLVLSLLKEPQWHLVYRDGNSAILLRGGPDTEQLYGNLYQDKNKGLLNEIVMESHQGLNRSPTTLGYYETLGNAYLELYEIDKAARMFEEYLSRDPDNIRVKQLLQNLQGLRPTR